jgi:hypothetical protein
VTSACEIAILVEDTIGRQMVFGDNGDDLTTGEDSGPIVEDAALDPWYTDDQDAIRYGVEEQMKRAASRVDEADLEEQIFWRITGDDEFGKSNDMSTELGRFPGALADEADVAREVADCRIDLRERDPPRVARHLLDHSRYLPSCLLFAAAQCNKSGNASMPYNSERIQNESALEVAVERDDNAAPTDDP